MSLLQTVTIACPACGHETSMGVYDSINADRRPDLRDEVLDGTAQEDVCEKCTSTFRMQPEMSYLDVGRNQWMLVQPIDRLPNWPELEQRAKASFEGSYGPTQSPITQEIGRAIQARVTFGWAAFREKLLAVEHGLDDVTLELVKMAIIRGLDDSPLADDTELRLVDLDDDEMTLAWLRTPEEKLVETLTMPRSLFDEIAADAQSWQALREELTAGTFVDVHRLLIAPKAAPTTE